jgi:hypothetical protein
MPHRTIIAQEGRVDISSAKGGAAAVGTHMYRHLGNRFPFEPDLCGYLHGFAAAGDPLPWTCWNPVKTSLPLQWLFSAADHASQQSQRQIHAGLSVISMSSAYRTSTRTRNLTSHISRGQTKALVETVCLTMSSGSFPHESLRNVVEPATMN